MSSNNRSASAGKKKEGGFLARQAKAKADKKSKNNGGLSERELLEKGSVTPDDVLKLNKTTESMYTLH